MKNTKFKIMGVEVEKPLPNTMAELAGIGLDEAAVVQTAVNQIRHHVFAGDVRENVAEHFEATAGVKREQIPTGAFSKAGKVLTRPEAAEKFLAGLLGNDYATQKEFIAAVKAAVETEVFAASSPREAKAKVNPDDILRLEKAQAMLDAPAKLSAFKARYLADVGPTEGVDWTNVQAVAVAFKEWQFAV